MPQEKVSISLDRAMIKEIDGLKGDVSRSRFIQRRLEDALKKEGNKR